MENLTTKIKTYVALALLVVSMAGGAALNAASPARSAEDEAIAVASPARTATEPA